METAPPSPAAEVLGRGVLAGMLGGLAAGAIDAIWSWRAAAQFAPGLLTRLRFVAFSATLHALAGFAVGLLIAMALLVVSRATRLGDLARFAWRTHDERRARDPRAVLAGLSLAIAGPPVLGAALCLAFRWTVKYVTNRHVVALEVAVAMVALVAAVAIATPVAFLAARAVETGLRRIRWRPLSSPVAPLVAIAVLLVLGAAVTMVLTWETARLLPLRAPIVLLVGLVLGAATLRPAQRLVELGEILPTWLRRVSWAGMPLVLLLVVLGFGASESIVKSATAFTGLGGPIAHGLRRVLDRDRDGFSPFLGGGDCDDGDADIHPGAVDIPDNNTDENCIGGDATARPVANDPAFAAVPASLPKDFDVLVITIDTTRADHLGMYGYPKKTSPNLDRLAADATVFDQGWAHAPSTRYSMPAILTGRLPLDVRYDHTVQGWPGLAPEAQTFAELLQPLGFATGAITNFWYFDQVRHMNQGFAEYDNENQRLHGGVAGKGPEESHGSSSKEQTDKAIAFVTRHKDQRWLLWVHYYDPHFAYEPHPECQLGTSRMELYDGELCFTDLHIGRLLDDLRAKGLYDRTVVVVTGDHGEGFGEHPVEPDQGITHGYHLYTELTKVPLIIKVPGAKPRHASTPAGHVDILPTLVNLAGGAPNAEMMGRSLVDVIGGRDLPRTIFQQLSYEGNNEQRAAIDGTCHVIYNVSPDTSIEAYRIDRDPEEAHDVSSDDCDDTRDALGRWYDHEQLPAGAGEALLKAKPAIAKPLDADLDEAVRILGVDTPASVARGGQLEVTWTFEALAKVPARWKLFAHIPLGGSFINGDHAPARPFAWWKRGDVIQYKHAIAIPPSTPPGHYTLIAGLYDGDARAAVTAPHPEMIKDNAVTVASFEVTP